MAGASPQRQRRRARFGSNLEREIDEEFAAHLEHTTQELMEQGIDPKAAREEALRRFGDRERYSVSCCEIDHRRDRARRRGELVNEILLDSRFALRLFRRRPIFVAGSLLTMALAVGVTAALFTVVNGLLLQPLPFPASDRLVQIQRTFPDGVSPTAPLHHLLYWRAHNQAFTGIAAYDNLLSGFNLAGGGAPERLVGSRVTRDFLTVFGVKPTLGRDFLPEEGRPGGRRVVILSHGLWSRRFGGDRGLLGHDLRLNGESYTVVGIMPPCFRFPAQAELWTPVQIAEGTRDKADYLEVTGRLKPGVTLAQAAAEMAVIARQFAATELDFLDNPRESLVLVPLRKRLYGPLEAPLLVLLGVVACVLLVACVNIGNFQLARAAERARELAVRRALGAGSLRIAGQLLTESVVLALIGGAAGLLLAVSCLHPLLALSPLNVHPLVPIHVDATVLAFTLAVSLLSGLLCGLLPALQTGRSTLNEMLKEGSARSTGGVQGVRIRRALIVAQVALALVPLILALQLVKSFTALIHTDPGFTAEHVLTLKLSLPIAKYGDGAAFERFVDQVRARAEAIPGVRSAVFSWFLPTEPASGMPFIMEGRYRGKGSNEGVGRAEYRPTARGLFAALHVPILRGRAFEKGDSRRSAWVALVNETAARRFWPREDPIGQRITLGQPYAPELADPSPRTIVGVVQDVRDLGVQHAAPPIIYVPLTQVPVALHRAFLGLAPMSLLVSTAGDRSFRVAAVKHAVWAADSEQPVTNVEALDEVVSRSLASERFTTLLLGLLAALALILAAGGIYAVLSYLVGQRCREVGVRMALGATREGVLWLFLRQCAGPVLLGAGLGLAAASALAHLMAHLLFGLGTKDLLAFLLGPIVLLSVALLASSVPAWRASRLDAAVALRKE